MGLCAVLPGGSAILNISPGRALLCMAIEVVHVPDEVLALAAVENGPSSIEAQMMAEAVFPALALDRQVFAFRVGDYMIVGPVPDARTERAMIGFADVTAKTTKTMNVDRGGKDAEIAGLRQELADLEAAIALQDPRWARIRGA